MRRSIRTVFVCMLIALIVYQPAVACHSCGGGHGYSYGPMYYGSGSYSGCCGGGYWTVVDNCDGCGSCHECAPCSCEGGQPYDAKGSNSDSEEMMAPNAPRDMPSRKTREAAPTEGDREPRPEATTAPQLPPSAPETTPAEQPRAAETPTGLFGPQPGQSTAPVEPAPPAATAPAPSTPPAATAPAPTEPPQTTSVPTTPPATTAPAPTPPPSTSTTPSTPAATTPPSTTPPAGATPPAGTAPPSSAPDELFGPPAPAEKPPAKNGATSTTTQKPAMTPASAEAKPAEKPAAKDSKASEKPAGQPAEKPAAAPAEEKKDKPEDKKKADDKDLFGTSQNILHEAGGLASEELRQWTDNTGKFSCNARLVRFVDGQIRLLKANGHTTTVPLARLSLTDLQFVNRQASAHRSEVGKTAQAAVTLPASN